MEENTDIIKQAYEKRKTNPTVKHYGNTSYSKYVVTEREAAYKELLLAHFQHLEDKKMIEIGAGIGGNLNFFHSIGIKWENIFANELLDDRFSELKRNYSHVNLISGDATKITNLTNHFDIVFQSTVFTSILDMNFKKKLAECMWKMKKQNGAILWYDFIFDNPANSDVKGIKTTELKILFPEAHQFIIKKVTLAPPIGRRVGALYSFFNFFPFLRTHVAVLIS